MVEITKSAREDLETKIGRKMEEENLKKNAMIHNRKGKQHNL